jgi:hypothetical protein
VEIIGIAMKAEMLDCLLKEIEFIRGHMNELSELLGLTHPEVMKVSLQLDELLLSFYKLAKNNN